MRCPKCHFDNPDDSKFCKECGTSITSPGQAPPLVTKTMETPREELTRGTLFAGRYEIIEELGKGGMGRVYRVEDTKIKEEIALKLINPEISSDKNVIERFSNELKTARKIGHRNVGRMFELMEDKGTHYITMEFVSGQDLKGLIRQSAPLSIARTISTAKQICEGLTEAHRLGVVHRDLKPSNIMIDRDGNARIMDFGIARSLTAKGITGAGVMIGTPEYMPPEQAEAKEVDERADIYSLGVILYEMVTGRLPFEGDTPLSVAMKHKGEEPKDPRELNAQIPEELSRVILKCLEKEKSSRYQNAEELRSDLGSIETHVSTTAKAVTAPKRTGSKEITVTLGVRKILVPALILVGLIVAVVVILQLLPKRGAAPPDENQTSVAVLPFEDLSQEQDQAIFCEGFAESLINALFKIRGLRIPAGTSSFPFEEKEWSYAQIGERLSVGTVLEGSVQKAENSLRIIVRLVKVSDGSILWSDQYSGTLDDVFSVQDEIALKIVENLKLRLAGSEKAELTRRHTASVEAYQSYLQGRYFRWREIRENFFKAKGHFEQAIAIDPDYAEAHSGLAEVYMLLGIFSHIPRDEAASQAKQAARRAVELAPDMSEAHASLGVILEVFDWDWEGAEREFIRALELNPNCFEAHYEYALLLVRLMRLDSAESHYLEALRIDPLSYRVYDYLGGLYELRGENEKAKEMDDKAHELYDPSSDEEDPIVRVQEWIEREGRRPASLRSLARAYLNAGDKDKTYEILDEMIEVYESSRVGNAAFYIFAMYYHLGDNDEFFTWLERSYERRDPMLINLKTSLINDPLREDPRFQAILKRMRLD